MYLYYLIGYKIDQCKMTVGPKNDQVTKDNSFILALDGDVHFRPEAVELVLQRMKRNRTVGACCNQIHPQGMLISNIHMEEVHLDLLDVFHNDFRRFRLN